MRIINLVPLLLFTVVISSCAGIKIYSDSDLKKKAAIKVHLPKPFLLVERNPSKDVALKASIIYLPDLAAPLYIKAKSGLGTSNLTLNLEKGYLSQYGAVTDSKIPETITAVSGLATAIAGLIASGGAEAAALQSGNPEELKKLEEHLMNIKSDLESTDLSQMSRNQKMVKDSLSKYLQKAIEIAKEYKPSRNEELFKLLEITFKQFDGLLFTDPQSDVIKRQNDSLNRLKSELQVAMTKLKPAEQSQPAIELYEIISKDSVYSLKRVNL